MRRLIKDLIGYDYVSHTLKVFFINTTNGYTSSLYQLSSIYGTWQESDTPDLYTIDNYFQIVAGDFNYDGRDEVVVGYVADGDNYGLIHFVYTVSSDGSANGIETTTTNLDNSLMHTYYNEFYNGSNAKKDKIIIDLAVGDCNGDDIDDLIVLSYPGASCAHNNDSKTPNYARPMLAILYGKYLPVTIHPLYNSSWDGTIWENFKYVNDYAIFEKGIKEREYVTLDNHSQTLINASVSCGDIDGDGVDEVVVAGYEGSINGNKIQKIGSACNVGVMYASYDCTNGIKKIKI